MKIGENIRKTRGERKMTQEQLANLVGVSPQAVSKWECGDAIPDGALFVPLAEALGISLDRLFGFEKVYENDVYVSLCRLIVQTPPELQLEKVREICWQTEKGLFFGKSALNADFGYHPEELKQNQNASSVADDTGFTFISNRSALPFFSVFPEPANGFASILRYDEKYRTLFEALGNAHVLRAFFYLYSREDGYIFEKEVLTEACGIPDGEIDDVMEKLRLFCLRHREEYEINGEKRILYTLRQRYELVAVFALLNELIWYANGFSLQICNRTKPYFEKRGG